MRTPLIRRLAAAAAAVVLLAVTGCSGGPADDRGTVDLTVSQITTADSAPLYMGIEKGFFKQQGLDVDVKIAESGSAIIPAVVSGDSPIAYANTVSDLVAIDKGLDLRFVTNAASTGHDPAKDTSQIFVARNSPIRTPADLAGKRIAVNSTKNLGDLTVLTALKKLGVDTRGTQWVPMNYSDMPTALDHGDVDAIWGVEPFRTLERDRGYRPVMSNFTAAFPDATLGYYITSKKYAQKHPRVVARFQKAMTRSNAYAAAHPYQYRRTAEAKVGIAPDVAMRMNITRAKPTLDDQSIRRIGAAAHDLGFIEKEPDYSQLFIK